MKVIFLDFDGVMTTDAYCRHRVRAALSECDAEGRVLFDPECVDNLRRIIDKTGADVVVSSDWKYVDDYAALLAMWHEREMPGFLTDVTPNLCSHRGDEIDKWIEECHLNVEYVIIDDLSPSNFNPWQIERLVSVDPDQGLTEDVVRRAVSILVR